MATCHFACAGNTDTGTHREEAPDDAVVISNALQRSFRDLGVGLQESFFKLCQRQEGPLSVDLRERDDNFAIKSNLNQKKRI